MDHHTSIEITQKDGRHRTGEYANDPGVTDQSWIGRGGRCSQETYKDSSGEGGTIMTSLKGAGVWGRKQEKLFRELLIENTEGTSFVFRIRDTWGMRER